MFADRKSFPLLRTVPFGDGLEADFSQCRASDGLRIDHCGYRIPLALLPQAPRLPFAIGRRVSSGSGSMLAAVWRVAWAGPGASVTTGF